MEYISSETATLANLPSALKLPLPYHRLMPEPLTIFLVEDNPEDVTLLRLALSELKIPFELTLAEDWKSASSSVEQLGSQLPRPQIAVVDLHIPGAEPDDVLKLIRSRPECSHLPILATTSSRSPKDLALAAQYNVRFVLKPGNWGEYLTLAKLIEEITLNPESVYTSSA